MKTLLNVASHIAVATMLVFGMTPLSFADSFTFYGLGHISLDVNDTGDGTDSVLASNSSRIGFNGEFNLGSNTELFYQYEPGVDLTGRGENDGNGPGRFDSLFTEERDWFVGLRSGAVSARVGRLGVLNHWLYDFDPFADLVGDLGNLWGATGIPGRADRAGLVEITINNRVATEIMWVPEHDEQAEIHVGKLKLSAGDLNLNLIAFSQDVFGAVSNHGMFAATGDWFVGPGQLGFGLQAETDIFGLPGNDRGSMNVGYTLGIGGGIGKFLFTHSNSELGQFDGSQWSIGYDYPLNSSLLIYAAASYVDNSSTSQFPANGYGHGLAITPTRGSDPASLSFGLIYQFSIGSEFGRND
ncbi:MAG: porin [Pseudomonadales bacterium]|nr:porin [Pseudomonadales bacterium]